MLVEPNILPIRTRNAQHWNKIIDTLYQNKLITSADLVKIWRDTTTEAKQYAQV